MSGSTSQKPKRGEIWLVNFNSPITAKQPPDSSPQNQLPTTGDEIYKVRPAIVMSISAPFVQELHIVVPVLGWKSYYEKQNFFWMVKLPRDRQNNLKKVSAANAFEVKAVSVRRFHRKTGELAESQLEVIAETIAYCVGL